MMKYQETKSKFSYLKMRNSLLEEIRTRLEISIENCNKLVILHIITVHRRLEVSCFITSSILPMTVDDIDTFLTPLRNFCFDQPLYALIIRVVKNLNEQPIFRPIELTDCRYRLFIYLH